MPKFYTMGTGRTTADEFQKRCDKLWRQIEQPYMDIIDIRRKGSRSRNGAWCYQAYLCGIKEPRLSNSHGGTQAGLRKYREAIKLASCFGPASDGIPGAFQRVLRLIQRPEYAVILLCSCGKAFKPNGKSWNCHRVPLALELLKELGDKWKVEHL